jgi:hypothetical protein
MNVLFITKLSPTFTSLPLVSYPSKTNKKYVFFEKRKKKRKTPRC